MTKPLTYPTIGIILLSSFLLFVETNTVLLGMEQQNQIGKLKTCRSEEIQSSRWGLQFNAGEVGKPDSMLEFVAKSGVKWARLRSIEFATAPEKGQFDWQALDGVVDGLIARSIKILVTLEEMNLGNLRDLEYPIKEELLNAWLGHIKTLVERYDDRVSHWEILNEPRLCKSYAKLVIAASKLIKQIDPDAVILAGSTKRTDVKGLELILSEGIAARTDVITFHPYDEFPEAIKYPVKYPVKKPETYMLASNLLSDMRALLQTKNPAIALWQGECGYPSAANSLSWQGCGPWGENIQAKWLARRFMVDLSLDLPVSIYFLLYSYKEEDRVNEKGLLRNETKVPKPAYFTLQNLTAVFDQDLNEPISLLSTIKILDPGWFYGIRVNHPQSFLNRKSPMSVEIEVVGVTGNKGSAVVYWLPWRMQEIVRPGFIDLAVHDIKVDDPVLVDLVSGYVYAVKTTIENGTQIFTNVPLVDYPMVILGKGAVKLQ